MFCTKCGASLTDDSLFCAKCGSKTIKNTALQSTNAQMQVTDTHSASEIKEYLRHAKVLETNLYTLRSTKERLQEKIDSLGIRNHIEKPQSKIAKSFEHILGIMVGLFFATLLVSFFLTGKDPIQILGSLLFGSFIIAVFASIFICFIIFIINCMRHGKALGKYNRKVSLDTLRVIKERQQIEGLQLQQTDLDCQIKETSETLEKLYSLNIVYPKYRDFIPILTFFEYFDSGRCYSLTGQSGAYNIYEYESRQDIIITKLNQVISMLAQIQANQYALYEAIQESTYYMDKMCNQAEAMVASSRAVERNSEIAAYNAKISADNSNTSLFLQLYK